MRPGEQSRGPEALDPWPGKCRISLGWVLDSRVVPQQDSLSCGIRPLGVPILSPTISYLLLDSGSVPL